MKKSPVLLTLGLLACGAPEDAAPVREVASAVSSELVPQRIVHRLNAPDHGQGQGGQLSVGLAKPTGQLTQAGIQFHGGAVMLGTITAYVIWYGNWTNNTATAIIPDFLRSLGGSPYWNINTTYTDASGTKLSNSIVYGGSYQYTGTSGYSTSLSDANIQTIVANSINGGFLPKNTNGIYLVLTSQDVTASSGFCTQYCGWHTYGTIGGSNIKYSFVGNPARCISSCAAQSTSPNGNAGADGMTSIIAHELEEAATDPNLNAWYDRSGYENADKCAWTFGTQSTASNGSKYNMTLGARNYLIQQNWVNSGRGSCAKSF